MCVCGATELPVSTCCSSRSTLGLPGSCAADDMCVCRPQPEALCILNTDVGVAVSMSLCAFHAGRCHGDPLFFISEGVCNPDSSVKLEWAKFRAQMSSKSSVQERCGLDTCYEWETCSGEEPLENICIF